MNPLRPKYLLIVFLQNFEYLVLAVRKEVGQQKHPAIEDIRLIKKHGKPF